MRRQRRVRPGSRAPADRRRSGGLIVLLDSDRALDRRYAFRSTRDRHRPIRLALGVGPPAQDDRAGSVGTHADLGQRAHFFVGQLRLDLRRDDRVLDEHDRMRGHFDHGSLADRLAVHQRALSASRAARRGRRAVPEAGFGCCDRNREDLRPILRRAG